MNDQIIFLFHVICHQIIESLLKSQNTFAISFVNIIFKSFVLLQNEHSKIQRDRTWSKSNFFH